LQVVVAAVAWGAAAEAPTLVRSIEPPRMAAIPTAAAARRGLMIMSIGIAGA
jgi:hypothetical protein